MNTLTDKTKSDISSVNTENSGANIIGQAKAASVDKNPAAVVTAARAGHPERIPMYKQRRALLGMHPRTGYHRRIVLERPDLKQQLDELKTAGYSVVLENGQPKRVMMNKSSGQYGLLIEIPLDLFQADQKAKAQEANERVRIAATPNPAFRQYIPEIFGDKAR